MKEPKLMWMLPLLGAIGIGVGFALMSAIMLTIIHASIISISRDFNEPLNMNIIALGATRGIIVGGMGGAALGLALKDRTQTYRLTLAGAIGFGWAFALVIIGDGFISDIGWAILRLSTTESYDAALAKGLGMGIVIGGIGGLVLGLALPKYRAIASLLLSIAGILSFSFAFVGGCLLLDGRFFSSWDALLRITGVQLLYYFYDGSDFFCPWNAWGGIVGGISLGIALVLYYKILSYIQQWQN